MGLYSGLGYLCVENITHADYMSSAETFGLKSYSYSEMCEFQSQSRRLVYKYMNLVAGPTLGYVGFTREHEYTMNRVPSHKTGLYLDV